MSAHARRAALDLLSHARFDVLVIGGGITGAGVARDAAMRGLRTALVERDDFASGTSSRSSRRAAICSGTATVCTSTRMLPWRRWNAVTAAVMAAWSMQNPTPTRSLPASPRAARRAMSAARSARARISRDSCRKSRPASVNSTCRFVRLRSVVCTSASSWRIWWLNDGCAIRSLAAAWPKCSASATATK